MSRSAGRIVVVGAGIGGPTAAIVLRRAGFDVAALAPAVVLDCGRFDGPTRSGCARRSSVTEMLAR